MDKGGRGVPRVPALAPGNVVKCFSSDSKMLKHCAVVCQRPGTCDNNKAHEQSATVYQIHPILDHATFTVGRWITSSSLFVFISYRRNFTVSFLANVNSCSRLLYVIVRPSICLLSVCNVRAPYSGD